MIDNAHFQHDLGVHPAALGKVSVSRLTHEDLEKNSGQIEGYVIPALIVACTLSGLTLIQYEMLCGCVHVPFFQSLLWSC